MDLAYRTRKFWCAAYFYRRAQPHRDRAIAVKVLEQVATVTAGTVKARATSLLKEIDHVADQHPTRAS